MAGEWTQTTVADVSHRVTKGTTPTTVGGRFAESGISFVKVESITDDGRFLPEKLAFIDEATNRLLERSVLQEGDVLFTIAGTIGRVAKVDSSILPANTNQAVAIIRPNRAAVDPRFLYYALRDVERVKHAHTRVVQSVQANFSLSELSSTALPLPPIAEQRAIAHILGTVDDKIELNRRMSETLEAMARALFKSWFVDFDPVRAKAEGRDPGLPQSLADLFPARVVNSDLGEIPESWEVESLDRIARFLNGLALRKYPPVGDRSLPVIKIAQLRAGNTIGADRASADLDADYVVHDGDILFSWSGSLECVLWSGGEGALNQHVFKVTSATYPRWLSYLGVHTHLDDFRHIAAGKATTMGHIQRHHLSNAKIVVPPNHQLLGAMNDHFEPLIESLSKRKVESRTLAALRDALLPKLISGELRVTRIERLVEVAM
jgi:type I restriction enzyme S subunit